MSTAEKRPVMESGDERDMGDSKYNGENQQTTLTTKVVEALGLMGGDRIIYSQKKQGEIIMRRWPRQPE